ncbi:putative mitochondrial protein, conserved [Hypocenomyce scalaris]|nr:putative mitochondrial protein, conserved [Hypocenomyce scalaris]
MPSSLSGAARSLSARRFLSTTSRLRAAPPFSSGPAPPRLPKEEQELFEQLQRSSTGAFSTPKTTVVVNQAPVSSSEIPRSRPQINQSPHAEPDVVAASDKEIAAVNARVQATGDGEELHPDIRRGVKPEFEGEENPKTGEIGGPKNEPLRWGGDVDWSYNGRVTDF